MVGFAATAALRRAMALAVAERERRAWRARQRRERQFSLLRDEAALAGLQRMLLGQLDLTAELLSADNGAIPAPEAVHESRKALKRLRTLVRLLEDELGEQTAAREQALLREAGRRLARTRDSEVLVDTLQQLIRAHPRQLERRNGVARLHTRLLAEREAATASLLADRLMRAEVLADLRAMRARMAGWQPAQKSGIRGLERTLRRIYAKGRRRHLRAVEGRRGRAAAMHRWRKSVKDLRYTAEALNREPAAGILGALASIPQVRPAAKHAGERRPRDDIRRLARRADRLGEMLGEEHDLFVLAQRVRQEGCGRGTKRRLLKLINRRRKRLRRRALRAGARLYGPGPKRLVGNVRRAYALQARE